MSDRRILEDVTVLDFTRVIAGPYCTRMLADMGANVIKIDAIPESDGPTRTSGSAGNNMGKRSITLDLKHPEGSQIARELVGRADVLVENFSPGVMDRLGLGFDDLKANHPQLIFASISGFGQSGSYAHRRAYGATAHAEAGWLWVQQQASWAGQPFAPGVTIADMAAGLSCFSGILAALYDRESTGLGQRVDVSLMDAQLSLLNEIAAAPLNGGGVDDWEPFRHPVHAAKDGHLMINIGSDHNWGRIAGGLGHPETPMPEIVEEANALVGSWVGELTAAEAAAGLESAGAPYGVSRSMPDAVKHPYFTERGMIVETDDPLDGSLRAINTPITFSNAGRGPTFGPPLAGGNTRLILRDLGRSDAEIDALIVSGAASEQLAPHS
ncbi:MAG: CaiB/BaiF CoA-transferase family protein [Dehalococcoidia bacterium]|jgi:crotonobetainyl-CoA:carnitine CoA-transferase CaiB-like acyl-CoA transferase|nr:CaiB/BaiF CoA-transferase family protein [Dehalococcoidia bacterium]